MSEDLSLFSNGAVTPNVGPGGAMPDLAARGRRRLFPRSTVLMRQGDFADFMYVIRSGTVRVERMVPRSARPLHLADLGPGQVVGEIGILNRTPRNATVVALTDVDTTELTREEMLRALTQVPGLPEALLQLVTKRLDETDQLAERIAFERRWSREYQIPWPASMTLTIAAHLERRPRERPKRPRASWPRELLLRAVGA